MAQRGKGLADKLAVLEKRDKLLRSKREKQTDILTATAIIGTCTDMCPEYERLFREEYKELSVFEYHGLNKQNEPDEYRMVKEYRRAGADQSEPLSHELRPQPVLVMTMDYLMTNIMDAISWEDSSNWYMIGDWFDFVWSRTRAIRKDITQQHLCDSTTVELLEKCVRFHIHCGLVLVEEDLSVFDQKINNENLTKCLQSLKHFYYDLNLKGISCEHESEFRCYDILLNLTNDDVMREVKHFPREIRQSRSVKFAIQAFYSLKSNNYVKFFQLVRDCSYLNACLLHRYFNIIRLQAAKLMKKAYTIGNQVEAYRLDLFLDQLGFENANELREFCDSIELSYNDNYILIKRGHIDEGLVFGANGLQPNRPRIIVESKRTQSVGEIIHGGFLPSNPYKTYPLGSSFDADVIVEKDTSSKNKFSSFTSEECEEKGRENANENNDNVAPSMFQIATIAHKPQEPLSESVINNITVQIGEDIFNSVIRRAVLGIASEGIVTQFSVAFLSNIFTEVVSREIRKICASVHNERREIAEKEKTRREEIIKTAAAESICANLIDFEISTIIRNTSSKIYQTELDNYLNKFGSLVTKELIDTFVDELVVDISKTCCEDAIAERDSLIHTMREKRALRLAGQCLHRWSYKCKKIKRFKFINATFPAGYLQTSNPSVKKIDLKRKRLSCDSRHSNNANTTTTTRQEAKGIKKLAAIQQRSSGGGSLQRDFALLRQKLNTEKLANKNFRESLKVINSSLKTSIEDND